MVTNLPLLGYTRLHLALLLCFFFSFPVVRKLGSAFEITYPQNAVKFQSWITAMGKGVTNLTGEEEKLRGTKVSVYIPP